MKHRLSKRIRVALPAEEAFQLFTPRGEREWAQGWDPTFPAPTDDDSEPGTVFQIDAHGHRGTWLVTDREWGRRIAYAQVVPVTGRAVSPSRSTRSTGKARSRSSTSSRRSARRVSTTSSSSPRITAIFCGRGRTRSRHASRRDHEVDLTADVTHPARPVTWAIPLKSRASRHR